MRVFRRFAPALVVLGLLLQTVTAAFSQATQVPAEKLDQMVAPIALYPDNLLSQIMMASTYPLEIVEADRWVQSTPKMSPKDREKALASKTWDPSVSSMTGFPEVLNKMSMNLEWTQALGEAFLAQQKDVMEAVQRMRTKAQQAGNLQSSEQQKVTQDKTIIVIQPANPEVIYVPTYNPTVVYGSAWAPSSYYYPAVMAPPVGWIPGTALAWGAGVAWGAAMYGAFNWHGGCCTVGHNYGAWGGYHGAAQYNNINVNRGGNTVNWQHNSYHRQNVNYQNNQLRQQYNRGGANNVNRGYGGAGAANRPAGGYGGAGAANRPAGGYGGAGAANRPAGGYGGAGAANRPAGGYGGAGAANRPSAGTLPANSNRYGSGGGAHAQPSISNSQNRTPFNGSNSGSFDNRASQRGASSRGVSQGNYQRSGSSPTRSMQSSGGFNRGGGGGYNRGGGGGYSRGGGGGSRGGGGRRR